MYDTPDSQSEQSANVDANEVPQYFSKFKRPSFSVDKRANPSTKVIPKNEDMPDKNLVSDDAALQASQLTFSETVQQIEKKLAQIHVILSQNPELATMRMDDFNPTSTVLKSVHEVLWSIFNAAGKFIGISTVSEPSDSFTKESSRDALTTTHPKTAQELISGHPSIQNAMNKLRALTGKIDYKNPRGRGAINPVTWIERNLIDKGLLTKEDVSLLPLFAWREVSPKLSQALSDSKTAKK